VAIHRLFGDHGPPVSSTKGQMGHLVAACGAVEAILCVLALRDGLLPPTRNLETPDPASGPHDLRRGAPRESRIRDPLTNAVGFGGSNGSLLFESP
jgi:3-oxoacyl-[acyl-carrier-protein] synthase II